MTSFEIERFQFDSDAIRTWGELDPKHTNWPVVYTIDGQTSIYVGETTHAATRLRQHLSRSDRQHLNSVRVVINDTFNKSACLDLESFLIRMFSGDGRYQVDNANAGLTGSDYFDRAQYNDQFVEIFDRLKSDGLFQSSITQIENSDLFKLSPYKALNGDQQVTILEILGQLFEDLRRGAPSTGAIQGEPGTGKTVVGIYLMKLLSDIRRIVTLDETDSDAVFAQFFTAENAALLKDFRMALVIPQQSLRKTVKKVFRKTSGLSSDLVLSAFEVGSASGFDLLIVDESHRLQQLSATMSLRKFREVNKDLFDGDERGGNQLDWIRLRSKHQLFLLDAEQSVRPASDIPASIIRELEQEAERTGRRFELKSQMRVRAGEDYVSYVRAMLSAHPPTPIAFADYDLRLFDDLGEMRSAILKREDESGLSRLIAGYAWEWRSKNDKSRFDIELDGERLQWNNTDTDWINSPTSVDEVGSIHTTQGYDLNFAGVIIGPDLRYDPIGKRLFIVRDSYFDTKGKSNNKMLGFEYTDDDLLKSIANTYAVLLTRGIQGTYVYVCDPELRAYLANFIPVSEQANTARRATRHVPDLLHPPEGEAPDLTPIQVELGGAVSQTDPSTPL